MKGSPVTQSVCDRAKLLSSVHGEQTVMLLTGLASGTLYRLKKRGWKAIGPGFRQRPKPSDFAIQARHMTGEELARHYRTSNTCIARWGREIAG